MNVLNLVSSCKSFGLAQICFVSLNLSVTACITRFAGLFWLQILANVSVDFVFFNLSAENTH